MTENYSFLKKFRGHNDLKGIYFIPLTEKEIEQAEQKLGFLFPEELKKFYQKIGHGIISCGKNYPETYLRSSGNDLLHPQTAATFYKPLDNPDRFDKNGQRIEIEYGVPIATDDEEEFMSGSTYETLEPGDMPFFEICDGSSYLVMRPHSDNPNAVWSDMGDKIEDSFEKFIWRLYYEHPLYYLKVIDPEFDLENN